MSLKIKKPNWERKMLFFEKNQSGYSVKGLDHWFETYVEPINKLLEDAILVTSYDKKNWRVADHTINLFKALLIDVQPLKIEKKND